MKKINIISLTGKTETIEKDKNTTLQSIINEIVWKVEWITDVKLSSKCIDWDITFIIREKWEK